MNGLKKWLRDNSRTCTDLSRETGMAHTTVLRIAEGQCIPRRATAEKLKSVTGLSMIEMISIPPEAA